MLPQQRSFYKGPKYSKKYGLILNKFWIEIFFRQKDSEASDQLLNQAFCCHLSFQEVCKTAGIPQKLEQLQNYHPHGSFGDYLLMMSHVSFIEAGRV